MTTEVAEVQITREEFEADCAWLHEYSDKVKTVVAAADQGSMMAAAKITRVFRSQLWVEDHLRTHPIKVSHRRGQPVRADTVERFTDWIKEHGVGDVYSRSRVGMLLNAHTLAIEYLPNLDIYSDSAVWPLKQFNKDRKAELPEIVRRIREIADGGQVTQSVVRRAVHDHNQSIIPAKVASSGRKTTTDHAAIIRSEFRILLNSKRFRDAGALLNELRAELMTAAGVTDDR
jgi:hypothetical protein